MNAFDELKLFVYESCLSSEMIEEMIDLMESCDEEDVQEVCESVEAFVTEANAYNKYADKYKHKYDKSVKRAELYHKIFKGDNREAEKKAKEEAYYTRNYAQAHDLGDIEEYNKHGIGTKFDKNNPEHVDRREKARNRKQYWMSSHGNFRTEKHPEERYKAGRYLDAQKELDKIDKEYKR